jgi:hypothetical protein
VAKILVSQQGRADLVRRSGELPTPGALALKISRHQGLKVTAGRRIFDVNVHQPSIHR